MKPLFTLALCMAALNAAAQSCALITDLVEPTVDVNWVDGDLRSDGGSMVVAIPGDGLGDLLVMRVDPAGEVLWSRRMATTDNGVALQPDKVIATSDGGALVSGNREVIARYVNQFAIKLDSTGAVQWARIYGPLGSVEYGSVRSTMVVHPSGGYVMTVPSSDGMCVSRLNAQGVPVWSKRYVNTSGAYDRLQLIDLLAEPDGDILLAAFNATSNGSAVDGPVLIHLTPTGDIDWSYRYSGAGVSADGTQVGLAANGDYLLSGMQIGGLMRVTSTGSVAWLRDMSSWISGDVEEFSSGEILISGRTNYVVDLVLTQADGSVIGSWNVSSFAPEGLVGIRSDSIILAKGAIDPVFNKYEPQLIIAASTADLNCAFTPASMTSSVATSPSLIVDPIVAQPDSVKTWTLSLGDAIELTQMDLEGWISAEILRAGWQRNIYLQLANFGGLSTGAIDATFTLDPQMVFISSVPPPTSVVGNTLSWTGLPPLDGLAYDFNTIVVTAFTPATVPIGTPITHTFVVDPDSVDAVPANNSHTLLQTVNGPMDPNNKSVIPDGTYLLGVDSILDYTIRFQNTGTDTAFAVVLVDTLPSTVSVSSFQPGAASHPYTYSLTAEGVLTFTFTNILLPDSNTNELESHGLVNFRIRPDAGLPVGTVISNAADIYFDFNAPVHTNDAVTVISISTNIVQPEVEKVLVYPMPVRDQLSVELPDDWRVKTMDLFSLDGRYAQRIVPQATIHRVVVPVNALDGGVYLLVIVGEDGRRSSVRFMKQ